MILELQALKKVRERIKETKDSRDLANAKKLLGVDSDGAREWEYLKDPFLQLEWVKEQFQSDLRATKDKLMEASITTNPWPIIIELISAIDSALEETPTNINDWNLKNKKWYVREEKA